MQNSEACKTNAFENHGIRKQLSEEHGDSMITLPETEIKSA